jgi:hypothetical protein
MSLLILWMNAAFAQTFSYNQGGTQQVNYYTQIPYENIQGKIIVTVKINGKSYRFLLDTGAPNIISSKLFKELQPSILTKQLISDQSSKKDSMTIVSLDELMLGDVTFNNIPSLVSDNIISQCFELDGWIGSNMLRNSIIQFSSIDHTIILSDYKDKLLLDDKQSSKLELSQNQSLPYFEIKLKDKKSISQKVYFDSGDDALYTLSNKIVHQLKKKNIGKVTAEAYGNYTMGILGNAKNSTQYRLNIPSININNALLQNVIVESTSHPYSRIGSKLLDYGVVTLDFKNKLFYFKPYQDTTNLEEKKWSINPTFKDGKFVVGVIWNEILLKDKVNIGDQILSIDGVDYTNISLCSSLKQESPFKNKNQITLSLKDCYNGLIKNVVIERY